MDLQIARTMIWRTQKEKASKLCSHMVYSEINSKLAMQSEPENGIALPKNQDVDLTACSTEKTPVCPILTNGVFTRPGAVIDVGDVRHSASWENPE